jgi:hypothetical protein
MKKRFPILTLIVILFTYNMACLFTGNVTPPARTIPVSKEAAQGFENAFSSAKINSSTGTAEIRITEPQITSYLTYELQKANNPIIQNPQVYLENNQIIIFGRVVADPIDATGKLVLTIKVDEQSIPKVDLVSAEFGAISIPGALLDGITQMVDQAIQDNLSSASLDYQLVSVNISDQVLVMTVRRK